MMDLRKAALVLALMMPAAASAEEIFTASAVGAADGSVECHWVRDRVLAVVSSPCSDFTAPPALRIGEIFTANGHEYRIGVIRVTRTPIYDPAKGGETERTSCVLAEKADALPPSADSTSHVGIWLAVPDCEVQDR